MKIFCYSILAITAGVLCGCSRNEVKISGRFVGNDDAAVYLERLGSFNGDVVDSARTDDKGYFDLKVNISDGQPVFYNLWCNNDFIPLLVSPGEKVKINSLGSISRNYTVEGSEGSERMRELKKILSEGGMRLDSILNVYGTADDELRSQIAAAYTSEYYRIKREQIAFIVSQPGSLASLYALYQRLPNDSYLFNGDNDIIYYRLVADSTAKYYPESPYVRSLHKEIQNAESDNQILSMLNDQLSADIEQTFPDIELPDMYGNRHKLSQLKGNVILLDFWSAASTGNTLINAELREVYDKYAAKGFNVYQVNVDENRSLWVNSVLDQKLPWISVSDLRGAASLPVLTYNISNVPSNFLINRNGEIVGKNIYGSELDRKVGQLINE